MVSGIGAAPDYETPLRIFSDSVVDSVQFGIGFVTGEDYKQMREYFFGEYTYAYLLNDWMTDKQLKEQLKGLEVSASDVDDAFFQEYWERTGGRLDEFRDALDELSDGAGELSQLGFPELTADNYETALQSFIDGSGSALMRMKLNSVLEQLKELQEFESGVKDYTSGVSAAKEGAQELCDGSLEFRDKTTEFLDEALAVSLSKLTRFVPQDDNPRTGSAGNDKFVDKAAGLAAGVSGTGLGYSAFGTTILN